MNDFTSLRKDYVNSTEDYLFPLAYLEKIKVNQKFSQKERVIVDQLKAIFQFQQERKLTQYDMLSLLSYLGKNTYVNAYIMALFLKNQELFREARFGKQIIKRMLEENVADSTIYTLIDCCIESDYNLFDEKILQIQLEKETLSLDTFSLIIDYIHYFRIEGFEEQISSWLNEDYPITIKIQLIDLFVELYSIEKLQTNTLFSEIDKKEMDNYIKTIGKENRYATEDFTILQSMFYGDFENSGKGNNGGLAIFLQNLGTELSKSDKIARVITLAITKDWSADQSMITEYPHGHLFVNIPMYINKTNPTDFLKKESFMKRTISRFLGKLGLTPDVYHVRFLDNASKAIAQLSKEQEKKLVVTLAPDPHRNMTDRAGNLKSFDFEKLVENLNKVLLGDELIFASDKIVGIGSRVVEEELEDYFPQLTEKINQHKVQMISEGIQTNVTVINQERKVMTDAEFEEMGLTKAFLEKPIILNVGRLNKLKAQDQLLKAWMNSDSLAIYNLLIIGGDLEHPNAQEKEMIDLFNEQLDKKPELKDHFLHLGALSNDRIRIIEAKIRAEQKDYPQIYLCSSQKEEFGIAILEALSQGLLVLGPEKGGVKSYLENGKNGFLIDTTDWKTIADETAAIIEPLKNKKQVFEKIQQAGEVTVRNNFSMEIITADFLSLYLSLQEKE